VTDPSFILAVVIVAVAAGAPWWLAFDHAGLRQAARNPGRKRSLLLTLATAFSVVLAIGFVALGALAAGAFLGVDGLATVETLLPLWLPLLIASAVLCTRRQAPLCV
jgi:hypothetical protein